MEKVEEFLRKQSPLQITIYTGKNNQHMKFKFKPTGAISRDTLISKALQLGLATEPRCIGQNCFYTKGVYFSPCQEGSPIWNSSEIPLISEDDFMQLNTSL